MNKRLSDLIRQEATIITPTKRLSRHLCYLFATTQVLKGKQAWQTPDCLPWTAWCRRNFELLSFRTKEKVTILNNIQQEWLWQDIINNSKYKSQILQTMATAQQALHAYEICQEWCVPIFPDEVYLNEDAFAFKHWAHAYEKQKQENNWLDDAALPDYITAYAAELKNNLTKIVFYDFDQLTTQQHKLKQAFLDIGIEVEECDPIEQNQFISKSEQSDSQSEIWSAACWAKQCLEENNNATIGIIAPNLNKLRDKLEYNFASVLTPEKWLKPNKPQYKPYAISLGKSLSGYPLIQIAINLLALGKRKLSINTLSNILHSQFITGATEEVAKRANFDAALRRIGEQQMSFKTLYWIAEIRCKEHEKCEGFLELLKIFEISFLSHSKQQTLHEWTISFSNWLTNFGWPGERSLDSDEHQTLQAWQKSLTQLASLDQLTKPVSFSTALFQLNRLLTETRFQPETIETPIQILGMTAAAGMQFDYLWVMDMQDDKWPAITLPNAYIPIACQRDFKILSASIDAQLNLAKHVTQKLSSSARNVVFSYARQEGDRLCRPSPLINIQNEKTTDEFKQCDDYKAALLASSRMEKFFDVDGPEIPTGKIANGTSALFKDQSNCPFRAFARHRLYAKSLSESDIGLSAAERGNLIHCALQFLWQRLKTSENQAYRSETELTKVIHSVVKEAIQKQITQQPETFTDRFTELEQRRLEQLLKRWLEIEKDRSPFKVIAIEKLQTVIFEDIELHLRIDRIDELADGRCIIIDYKTGAMMSKGDWDSNNPKDPQLPLYAVTSKREVAAIAFANLKRGKLGFSGQVNGEDILPGIKSDENFLWQDRFSHWESVLIKLANDFRSGKAIVEPTATACRYCDLHTLCRIHERKENIDDVVQLEADMDD
jgi:ATP-dependent helicase/nuclease subunit B